MRSTRPTHASIKRSDRESNRNEAALPRVNFPGFGIFEVFHLFSVRLTEFPKSVSKARTGSEQPFSLRRSLFGSATGICSWVLPAKLSADHTTSCGLIVPIGERIAHSWPTSWVKEMRRGCKVPKKPNPSHGLDDGHTRQSGFPSLGIRDFLPLPYGGFSVTVRVSMPFYSSRAKISTKKNCGTRTFYRVRCCLHPIHTSVAADHRGPPFPTDYPELQ